MQSGCHRQLVQNNRMYVCGFGRILQSLDVDIDTKIHSFQSTDVK
jgi:hypothetical protein